MDKKFLMLPFASILVAAMAGCTGNQGAEQPLGYYSNDKGNEVDVMDDREGPVTEMMDHSFGKEARVSEERKRAMLQSRDENGNPPNPTVPRSDHDHNFFQRDNRYSRGDVNYHGHLNENRDNPRIYKNTEEDKQDAKRVEQAVEAIDNVDKVRSVMYGREVEIAVDLKDKSLEKKTKKEIEKAVTPMIEGRELRISTDEGTFSRSRDIDYNRKNGNPRESINLNGK
ncbi:YhcN/YlaJ family sporulation lipoprotein [Bacillus sp. REN3]|uniref:YhcN/YlaJ family sporulation lipoprotein n=1 Tax=Bacillus sp. REN3 TaxID=2802440 RepID=UPI001AEDC264|nr:YhcN/YlaJ family sporulation lipoprotein [Bacillus sp. REN3]